MDRALFQVEAAGPIAEKLAAVCPLDLEMIRAEWRGYLSELPEGLSDRGCERTVSVHRDELCYFGGRNAPSIPIADVDTPPYGLARIGAFGGPASEHLAHATEAVDVRISAPKDE